MKNTADIYQIEELRQKRLLKLQTAQRWLELAMETQKEIRVFTEQIQYLETLMPAPYEREMPLDWVAYDM